MDLCHFVSDHFCETGLVVTPLLPGDSLLFAAGAVAAMQGNPINISALIPLMLLAAFVGDNTNYSIGRFLGLKVYEKNYRLIKRKYLEDTHAFMKSTVAKPLLLQGSCPSCEPLPLLWQASGQ